MLHVVVSLIGSWHVVSTGKVHEILKDFLVLEVVSLEVLPWLPIFHNSQELHLVVSLEDQFLDEASGKLILDSSDGEVLIDDFHSVSSQLLR